MTFGHKMAFPAELESHWNITSIDFANEDLASLLDGDGSNKVDLVASMHMPKLQRLTAKLGKTVWNDISSMHVPFKAALNGLNSQILRRHKSCGRSTASLFHV